MKIALMIVGAVVALVVLVVLIGFALPKNHVATVTARIAATPTSVWSAITDPPSFTSWRTDVTSVETLSPAATGPSWREHGKNGTMTMVIDEADAPRRLVTRIADTGLPFGGRWIYRIEPDGESASRVTITEDGFVSNPIFRFVSRFIIGHTATLEGNLRALSRKFGSEVAPTVVAAGR